MTGTLCISVLTSDPSPMSVTLLLLAATSIVSLIAFSNRVWIEKLVFNPYIIEQRGQWYRFLTSGMIHADMLHLLINMLVLYSFGGMTEYYYDMVFGEQSTYYFLCLYFGGMAIAVLPSFNKHRSNPGYNALGASGAVSAVVFSFIFFEPLEKICLYGILCLPGILFGAAYLIYCVYSARKDRGRVNHDAHFWGALYGMFFTAVMKPTLVMAFFQKLIYFRHAI